MTLLHQAQGKPRLCMAASLMEEGAIAPAVRSANVFALTLQEFIADLFSQALVSGLLVEAIQ
uniref:Uncharacterized protein n=1 Tax=Thermogemmatispora argillosa TaxID=2045280 RepID=A0A455SV13_9CHLR|nr:hypothetical protein KTA_04160 [Thermogemmatispora argillosa]